MRKNRRAGRGLIGLIIIIFLVFMFIFGYIWRALKTSAYFKLKYILTRKDQTIDLSYLKGKNIFSVDLRSESRYILDFYPDSKSIRIVRLLPDSLFVDFVNRKPIAYVKLYRNFSVDEDGVLFNTKGLSQDLELPIVLGLETKIFGPKPGKRYNIKELELALNIIKELKRNSVLKKYKIERINVVNPADVSIFMGLPTASQDLEIKLNSDSIKNKMAFLGNLFVQENNGLDNIKYIDLRFKEPVIKYSDVKSK